MYTDINGTQLHAGIREQEAPHRLTENPIPSILILSIHFAGKITIWVVQIIPTVVGISLVISGACNVPT